MHLLPKMVKTCQKSSTIDLFNGFLAVPPLAKKTLHGAQLSQNRRASVKCSMLESTEITEEEELMPTLLVPTFAVVQASEAEKKAMCFPKTLFLIMA